MSSLLLTSPRDGCGPNAADEAVEWLRWGHHRHYCRRAVGRIPPSLPEAGFPVMRPRAYHRLGCRLTRDLARGGGPGDHPLDLGQRQ